VTSMAFHPSRLGCLATAGSDGEVLMWDLVKRIKVCQLVQPPTPPMSGGGGETSVSVPSICFNRTGEWMAFARSDDWTGGEEMYKRIGTSGHRDEVFMLPVPAERK
ncbi:MAG: hypothetical protein SGPRY_002977, partial [Prymnesium sp.]